MDMINVKSEPLGRTVIEYEIVVLDMQLGADSSRKMIGCYRDELAAREVVRRMNGILNDLQLTIHKVTKQTVTMKRETIYDSTKEI